MSSSKYYIAAIGLLCFLFSLYLKEQFNLFMFYSIVLYHVSDCFDCVRD